MPMGFGWIRRILADAIAHKVEMLCSLVQQVLAIHIKRGFGEGRLLDGALCVCPCACPCGAAIEDLHVLDLNY